MSAIYTYGQWIDIVDRGTSGDQVMDILASWKVDAYKLLEDNHKLEAELARIAELEAAQRWIPVSERLPEDGETVFVIIHDGFERFENGNEVARLTYLGNGNWWSWGSERYVVTHWMSLPNPPEVK